jgi:hypothetical protein
MQKARADYEKMRCKEHIKTDYDVLVAANWLSAALDRIEELEAAPLRLTAEQRAALDFALTYLSDDPNDMQEQGLIDSIKTIGTMLGQSAPAWQITEERKAAIWNVLPGGTDKEREILQTMLAEAEGKPCP